MSRLEDVVVNADWLRKQPLQKLFDLLLANGGEAMVAGGAVRNALMGLSVDDIDLCTSLEPSEVVQRLKDAGYKAIPTGIEHGTITAVLDGEAFEVTTLREDIETDGRHAVVKFGSDWQSDALRRDLTINGLYCDRDGNVFDYVDGYADLMDRNIRFIGDATARIEEDALRILRFFRFFAWYGSGRPDALGLKACAAKKHLISGLSAERIWMELRKLLAAKDPGRALLWMRTAGILSVILPETEKWGIDAIPGLIRLEQENAWGPDPMHRLMAVIRPDMDVTNGLADRLKLSNRERDRLSNWVQSVAPDVDLSHEEFFKKLYRSSAQGMQDVMRLEAVHLINRDRSDDALKMIDMSSVIEGWQKPIFPVKGSDLIDAGHEAGPELGAKLDVLEEKWVESGFALSKPQLINGPE